MTFQEHCYVLYLGVHTDSLSSTVLLMYRIVISPLVVFEGRWVKSGHSFMLFYSVGLQLDWALEQLREELSESRLPHCCSVLKRFI